MKTRVYERKLAVINIRCVSTKVKLFSYVVAYRISGKILNVLLLACIERSRGLCDCEIRKIHLILYFLEKARYPDPKKIAKIAEVSEKSPVLYLEKQANFWKLQPVVFKFLPVICLFFKTCKTNIFAWNSFTVVTAASNSERFPTFSNRLFTYAEKMSLLSQINHSL